MGNIGASFLLCLKWFALFVKKKSTCGSIIASVKLGKPFSVDVLGNAAAHFIGVGPNHGSVMADIGTKPVKMIQNYKVCIILLSRDNSLELLQPMTANPISFELSRVLRYVTSKEIRQTVL